MFFSHASFTSAALLISVGTVTTYTAGDAAATLPRQLAITSFMLFAHAVWPSVIASLTALKLTPDVVDY